MNRDRWARVDELFHAALARVPSERDAFLVEACGGDEETRREVESLLAHEREVSSFLEPEPLTAPAARLAHPNDLPVGAGGWSPPTHIAHYRVLSKIGEGGMGVVYLAADEKLGRRVALKLMRKDSADPQAAKRLVREARVAAGVSHPLICQVFELGEWNDQPFIAMELVEGESLASRLTKGAMRPAEALRLAISIVEALAVLHRHGIVHRDLKPSNVFLTMSGAKVLDFGLARPLTGVGLETVASVTQEGMIVGTPQYASPEQLSGTTVDARADLFSLGVMLFEMLAGRRPFGGATLPAIVHAVLYETPPVLTGSPAIAAVDRVLHRALAKRPVDRHPDADALATDLRAALALVDDDQVAQARPILRLAVLPFRLLKPDPEIEYLSLSIADALTSSLSGLESLVVRSSLKSAKYAGRVPDLDAIATDLAVDLVLTGSLIRHGDRLRVGTELASVPAGDVWWNQTTETSVDAVFDLHNQIAQRVVASLPLSGHDRARSPARSASKKAFDLYLRGMQLRMESSSWRQARTYFDQCLAIDPGFAPAWAERGRIDRVLGKFEDPSQLARAESALLKAQALDPDNGAAIHYLAQLDIDVGRLEVALTRLLQRAQQGRAEPQVYAALVQACRYAGLLDASIAAHERALQLDPTTTTSVHHTFYQKGDYERALEAVHLASDPLEARLLGAMGRDSEAIAAGRREEERFAAMPRMRSFATGVRAALEGRKDEALAALNALDVPSFWDGEGLFYISQIYARLGCIDDAFAVLDRSAASSFACLPAFERDPYLAPLRGSTRWPDLIAKVKARHQLAAEAYVSAGGRTILL
jgi:serine/threonine protein kinase